MSPLTRRNWEIHEQRSGQAHLEWLRSLAPEEALSLYESFHRFMASHESDPEGTERIERRRWEEKLARRRRMVEALTKLDRVCGGRRDPADTV